MSNYNDNLVNIQAKFDLIPETQIVKNDKYIASPVYYQQIFPNETSPYSFEAQKVATFDLASPNCALDMLNSTLEGDMAVSVGTTFKLDGDAHSLFARVRLISKSGVVFEDAISYNARH